MRMSLFNLFRKAEKAVNNPMAAVEPPVQEAIFVDNQAPASTESVEQSSLLDKFLRSDYEQKGYNDGYLYPNGDLLENNIRQLKTRFRQVVDHVLDQKRAAISELNLHLINTQGISERLEASLREKVRQLENLIHELDTQKILSVEEEGMIAPVVQGYRIGFIKGVERFNQEKIFAGSTRLF
jgi:hypothetical protein